MDRKQQGLANDYLRNAAHFLWAAEQLNEIAPSNTVEGLFKAEAPLYSLMGHSAELIMKAALAKIGVKEKDLRDEYRHDLKKLLLKFGETQLHKDKDFQACSEAVSENFKNHDYRYARVFSGFSDEDQKRYKKGELTEKEKREYGLVVKSGVNVESFLQGIKNQIEIVSKFIVEEKAA